MFPKITNLKTHEQLQDHAKKLGLDLPLEEVAEAAPESPLAEPLQWSGGTIGNRFCILPMEGWDGTLDGKPTDLTTRRWENFGRSGAKFIWGGEAVAVRHDGRANPNQLLLSEDNLKSIEGLRVVLENTHKSEFGTTDDLLVGLQLTHSGRFSRPNEKKIQEPSIAYRHPVLDSRSSVTSDESILSDDDLCRLVDQFIASATLAAKVGFAFVDIKHCHGYLGHELLSGIDRPGKFGGSFENRTRFLRDIVEGIRTETPELAIGVRLSIFDFVPYTAGDTGMGEPAHQGDYQYAFGGDGSGTGIDLSEPKLFVELLKKLRIELLCTTAGSPYYNPHIQRPAFYPPSDGYQPPEDPLFGVERQITATGNLKQMAPDLIVVGSGYSYLQEWLPNVGQAVVRSGLADSIGLGRMVLSYPELPADVLAGKSPNRKKVCRTFSDCTTAPRNGIVSGCYPLDPHYKSMPERELVAKLSREVR